MRIDVVTIFPDFLQPLRQALPGKAIDAGIIDLAVHVVGPVTEVVHRQVDDPRVDRFAGQRLSQRLQKI
ncbi:MAG TPA: hypothetical protein VHH12_09115, partial [Mycobacterium sp.]|nr:hypothetical protein [Mycobacterium sp.]